MKFNRADNKIYILDCWVTHPNELDYKLWVKPMCMKNIICVGIYTDIIELERYKSDILFGYDDIYEFIGK